MTSKAKLSGLAKGKTVVPPVQSEPRERDNPVHRFVEQLRAKDGIEYRTTAEVAAELGVSSNWVRKVQRQQILGVPSLATKLGQINIYLYTPQDVEKIRDHLVQRQSVFPAQSNVQTWGDVANRRVDTTRNEEASE